MTEPITISSLKLTGFRAYLRPKTFVLHDRKKGPLSLAVFAPNGRGKSSMVDSLEYYFRKDGSLERLGKKLSPNQAGIEAIRHVDAERLGVETSVHVQFRQGSKEFDDARPFAAPLTDSAKRVLQHIKVPFVIRGYELRRFIEETSPIKRYEDLVTWLDLSPLLAVQENMNEVKRKVKKKITDTTEADLRLRDLADATDNAIHTWDERAILEWFNMCVLAPLGESIKFGAMSDADPAFQELERQRKAELERAGLETLENLLGIIESLRGRPAELPKTAGQIAIFEKAVLAFKDAVARETAARSAASESVFSEVWASAKRLFEGGSEFDKCPVCDTDFAKSPGGSRVGVYNNLDLNLANLKEYREAEDVKKKTEAEAVRTARELVALLDQLLVLVSSEHEYGAVTAYRETLRSWKVGKEAPGSTDATQTLAGLHDSVSADMERIGRQRGEITYGNALEKFRRILSIKAELARISSTKGELREILGSLDRQTEAFNTAIVGHIRGLVDSLVNETRIIYGKIHGPGEAPRIQIKLAKEGDTKQRSVKLLIDFADREGVVPGGYLSDSQVHTLALSIRLAAIRLFNTGVKTVALDDIVTSYDADHRKNVAVVLNDYFDKFQIILVTHDMQFFDILRDHLDGKRWEFKRIKELRPGIGPIFDDRQIKDEEIEEKIRTGKNAANDIRIAEEAWLYQICHEFETPTVFRHNQKPSMSEMALSLDKFLKECGLGSPTISGHSKPFLQSMHWAKIENMGSHHRDDPYASSSEGDTSVRWEEFKRFRNMFKCKCGHTRFERPRDWKKPACRRCKIPFSFGQDTQT